MAAAMRTLDDGDSWRRGIKREVGRESTVFK